ncbi:MAG: SAM-dependent chlorinase/fluorinase [Candidatus Paceibacterota bacterium]|jgi:hypothetical protein
MAFSLRPPVAATLTDFSGHYLAALRAVIISRAPDVRLMTADDSLPPGDIRRAAFELLSIFEFFPAGTVFVCVADPGVGTDRRIVFARTRRHRFLAPDNGLLSWVEQREKFIELRSVENPALFLENAGAVFNGRDIFAPVCAALLNGTPPSKLGPRIEGIKRLPFPQLRKTAGFAEGEIIFVDSFGNCVTNIPSALQGATVRFKGRKIRVMKSYGFAKPGEYCAVRGSAGFMELAVNGGSFAAKHGASIGAKARLIYGGD